MSALMDEWRSIAQGSAQSSEKDVLIACETRDPRVPFPRRIAIGGVADLRHEKPGVLLVALVDDPDAPPPQILGVCSKIAAQTIIRTLRAAWPDLA